MFLSRFTPVAAAVVMALAFAAPAMAYGDHGDDYDYDYEYDRDHEDRHADPLAGRHIARDYLTGEYYQYQGTPVRDPRVEEQEGWRDGVLRTPPRWYWSRCGCSRLYYGGRWYSRPRLYDYGTHDYSYRNRLDYRTSYEYRWPRRNW